MFNIMNLTKILAITIWFVSVVCSTPVLYQNVEPMQDVKPEFPNGEPFRPNPLNELTKIFFNHKTEENPPNSSDDDVEPENRSSFRPMYGVPFMKRMSGCCRGLNRRLPMVMERVVIVKPVPIPILLKLLIHKEGETDEIVQNESKLPVAPEAQSNSDYPTSDIPLTKQGAPEPEPEPETQPQPIDEPIIENNSIDQQKDEPNDTVVEESKVDDDSQQQESKSSEVLDLDNNINDVQNGQETIVADDETKADESSSSSSSSVDKNEEQTENKADNEEENKIDDDTAKYDDNGGDDIDDTNEDENGYNEPTY
ncbi:hypothetical protein BLA29_002092 [Euroglyphus maynei]|uniref:Uncharacterized protein n=1 Tax=Euroglyphus maynei TaxID=6958 RepID=A0A1Y3ATY1_EURMA|nr:hypothetical protein BLA29_002092 [Euroglyphus maynei]